MLLKKEVRRFLKNGDKKLKLLYKPFVCYAFGPIQKPGKYLQVRSTYNEGYYTSAIIVFYTSVINKVLLNCSHRHC